MAYHIYQTEGLVLRGVPEGESSKYVEIFTKDLGLIGAHARSVREERSKLRFALQDYSHSRIALVRGKHGWKIVNAAPNDNYFERMRSDQHRLSSFVRIAGLVRKLVAGEERNEKLYATFMGAIEFLASEVVVRRDFAPVQIVAALRILHHLGYGVTHPELARLASEARWDRITLDRALALRAEADRQIRDSLSETHL